MQLIPINPPSAPPAAKRVAESELAHINASFVRRIEEHKARYRAFWDNPEATPDEILAAMNPEQAAIYLAAASASAAHIAAIAGIVGKSMEEFIDPAHYVPRRNFILENGSVVLAPPAPEEEPTGESS